MSAFRPPTGTAIGTCHPTSDEAVQGIPPVKRFSVSRSKLAPTERKLRGGYYTPTALADYLCGWAVRSPNDHVLEPSCGDGSFIRALAPRLSDRGRIAAVELVAEELAAARRSVENSGVSADWRCGSFFDFAPEYLRQPPFDAVVGNPPFIRFQHFDKEARDRAFQLLRPFGYHPNGLANAWAAFVQLAAEMLRDGGRLAMVLPAELMQVQYAAELRFRLPHLFEDVSIITFGELVFPEIQQEVVLLLAEGRRRSGKAAGRLHAHQVRNGDALLDQGPLARLTPELPERYTHEQMKWTALFLDRSEFQVLDACLSHQEFGRLGSWVDVDVGIVTGRNSFFVVDRDEALKLGVDGHVLDVVGRTSALKSIRFTQDDLHGYGKTHPSKLLSLAGLQRSQFSEPLNEYILAGEAQGVHAGYKCRIRNRWFDVPSVYVPDGFMHRQVHHAPCWWRTRPLRPPQTPFTECAVGPAPIWTWNAWEPQWSTRSPSPVQKSSAEVTAVACLSWSRERPRNCLCPWRMRANLMWTTSTRCFGQEKFNPRCNTATRCCSRKGVDSGRPKSRSRTWHGNG